MLEREGKGAEVEEALLKALKAMAGFEASYTLSGRVFRRVFRRVLSERVSKRALSDRAFSSLHLNRPAHVVPSWRG